MPSPATNVDVGNHREQRGGTHRWFRRSLVANPETATVVAQRGVIVHDKNDVTATPHRYAAVEVRRYATTVQLPEEERRRHRHNDSLQPPTQLNLSPLPLDATRRRSSSSSFAVSQKHQISSRSSGVVDSADVSDTGLVSTAGYQPLQQLGKGGCGTVWLVERTNDRSRFAAKVVRLSTCMRKSQQAVNEPEFLSRCHSPFIVRYVDRCVERNSIVTMMEYVEGVDMYAHIYAHIRQLNAKASARRRELRRRLLGLPESSASSEVDPTPLSPKRIRQLEKDPALQEQLIAAQSAGIPESEVIVILTQVLVAVDHMHSRGIIHRDLKSSNIFLSKLGVIKLGDFGLSQWSNCSQSSQKNDPWTLTPRKERPKALSQTVGVKPFLSDLAVGTPSYMAPELWCTEGMPPYSEKSDMWALGAVLFEMLTGRMAYPKQPQHCIGSAIVAGVIDDIRIHAPSTSQAMVDLVARLLSTDPSLRPSALEAMSVPIMRRGLDFVIKVVDVDDGLGASRRELTRELIAVKEKLRTLLPLPPRS